MSEQVILDPVDVATGRSELEITPWVRAEGIDWGDAAIEAYMAEQARGSTPVDYRVPNRTITIPLVLKDASASNAVPITFASIRSAIQGKVAIFQQEGGWLKRVLADASYVFVDIVSATLHLSGSWLQAHRDADVEAVLTLEAIPDFYGDEVALTDHVETTNDEMIFTETGIKGDYPGRVRVVVDNGQATDQKGLIWGFRSRYYDSASTAALAYEAEALTPVSPATSTTVAGASGGNAIQLASTPSSWTAVMNTNLAGAFLTHKGTYRVLARVAMGTGSASLRLVWDVGDLVYPAENGAWAFPGPSAFYIADLGQVRLDPTPVGPHRWQGQIQARGATGGETVDVDKLWLVPVDEGMGLLSAPVVAQAVDSGVWGPKSGGTFADDATVGTVAWTDPGNAAASDDVRALANVGWTGQQSHYLKATNFGFSIPAGATINGVLAEVERSGNGTHYDASVKLVKAGAITGSDRSAGARLPVTDAYGAFGSSSDLWGTTLSVADVNNSGFGVGYSANYPFVWPSPVYVYVDHIRITVYYTPVSTALPDAVMYASRSAQLTTQGIYRQDSTGTAYGPMSQVIGDLPRIPPSLEGRTTEVFLKGSRGDLDQLVDSAVADDISCQMFYRPSYLTAPEQ